MDCNEKGSGDTAIEQKQQQHISTGLRSRKTTLKFKKNNEEEQQREDQQEQQKS